MSTQLPLDLPHRAALGREAFFVSPANAVALAQVDNWAEWPEGRLALIGPAGAGKTHLASVWAQSCGAVISPAIPEAQPTGPLALEDAETLMGHAAAEEALFHLINAMRRARLPLLITARQPPAQWAVHLPDLRSRLTATLAVQIEDPDDTLLRALLLKHFTDRQLDPPAEVLDYLLPRIERSARAAAQTVAALDAAQLAKGGRLTVPLARQVLDKT